MSFRVTIQPSQRVFNVEPGETVLAGAMRNGIVLPYGCRNGACGACKGKVLEGTVDYGEYAAHILPDVEKSKPLANVPAPKIGPIRGESTVPCPQSHWSLVISN